MARYQAILILRPADWTPARPDDVPPQPGELLAVLAEADDLFVVLGRAIEHNQQPAGPRWAVVVEPGVAGRTWPAARLCTPLVYRVASVWWPEGWEPKSPLDVPGCVWPLKSQAEAMPYPEAVAAVAGLNRQAIEAAGTTWYVVAATENEPAPDAADPAMHVARPGGRGDCSHCPAHALPCAAEQPAAITAISK